MVLWPYFPTSLWPYVQPGPVHCFPSWSWRKLSAAAAAVCGRRCRAAASSPPPHRLHERRVEQEESRSGALDIRSWEQPLEIGSRAAGGLDSGRQMRAGRLGCRCSRSWGPGREWGRWRQGGCRMIMTPWEDLFFVINNLLLGEEPVRREEGSWGERWC